MNMILEIAQKFESAREAVEKEEARQRSMYHDAKLLFQELTPQLQMQLAQDMIMSMDFGSEYLQSFLDRVIEPCPLCGSNDLFIKTKQLYHKYMVYNPKTLMGEEKEYPLGATGSFLCGNCKRQLRVHANSITEVYQKWNLFANRMRVEKHKEEIQEIKPRRWLTIK